MIKFIKKYVPVQLLYAASIILLTGIFIVFVQLVRTPNTESVAEFLVSLPYYSTCKKSEELTGVYKEISDTYNITVYKATDSTSCEFAVALADSNESAEIIIEKLKARKSELDSEFIENPDELMRIYAFKIINVNKLVTFMVYDTERTAENALHTYFTKSGN